VRLHRAVDGAPLGSYAAGRDVWALAALPGRRFVASARDGLTICDAATGSVLAEISTRRGAERVLVVSPDGKRVIRSVEPSSAAEGELLPRLDLVDLEARRAIDPRRLGLNEALLYASPLFLPSGTLALFDRGLTLLRDGQEKTPKRFLERDLANFDARGVVAPDADVALFGSIKSAVVVDLEERRLVDRIRMGAGIACVAFGERGRLAVVGKDGVPRFYLVAGARFSSRVEPTPSAPVEPGATLQPKPVSDLPGLARLAFPSGDPSARRALRAALEFRLAPIGAVQIREGAEGQHPVVASVRHTNGRELCLEVTQEGDIHLSVTHDRMAIHDEHFDDDRHWAPLVSKYLK
jgi:hypothetical protein